MTVGEAHMLLILKFHTLIIIYLPNLCACINLYADLTYLIFEDEDQKAGRLRKKYIMAFI